MNCFSRRYRAFIFLLTLYSIPLILQDGTYNTVLYSYHTEVKFLIPDWGIWSTISESGTKSFSSVVCTAS
jgi:hypothetical protein